MKRLAALLALTFLAVFHAGKTLAHEVRPAYLQIVETAPHHYTISWKQPILVDIGLHLVPHLSSGWLDTAPVATVVTPAFIVKTWSVSSALPLTGQKLSVEGLDRSITDVLVRASVLHERPYQTILKSDQPAVVLSFDGADGLHLPAYILLGVEHILTGPDHLSFVLGLMLLVGLRWRLIKAITAFTLAHSITLGAAALGFVHFPPAIIEALVAMSILFLATELVHARNGATGLTERYPWLIAFTFGLLHGLAFAGALADVGLPPTAIPQALFLFNVGVECGQLMFIAVAAAIMLVLTRVFRDAPTWWQKFRGELPPYAIGSFAAFWFIERLVTVFA